MKIVESKFKVNSNGTFGLKKESEEERTTTVKPKETTTEKLSKVELKSIVNQVKHLRDKAREDKSNANTEYAHTFNIGYEQATEDILVYIYNQL